MKPITGVEAMLRVLAQSGVRYVFGNPGTTELPLNDVLLSATGLQYILGLQEVPVMAMADGLAQASRAAAVVNLHICCGLGNAMGMLYNAYREGTPLVVTAGQQDRRMAFEEPILWGDMVSVARPWTKWAAEVQQAADVPVAMRRALQLAASPPTGPVFLALPIDVQMETAPFDLPEVPPLDVRVRPPADAVRQAAEVLAAANNPVILVGSRVCEADAVDELIAVAQRLGAPVMHEAITSHGRCSFPSHHPLAGEELPMWSPEVRKRLADFDVVLVAAMKLMQQYIHHQPSRAIPEHLRIVQLDDSPWEINKNYPAEVGLIGHPKPTLAELAKELDAAMSPAAVQAARQRLRHWEQEHSKRRAELRRQATAQLSTRPLTPLALMESLARVLPDNVAVVEEAPTTTGGYFERSGALKNADGYFAQRGWALGWGLNCAIGVQLAWPDRPVLALIGDGSAMYGIQGLWTAARYGIAVTFVICNNREYRILKQCAGVLNLPAACRGQFTGLDIGHPDIDYVGLARSLGVEACRIDDADQLSQAVAQSLAGDKPRLLEVPTQAAPGEKS